MRAARLLLLALGGTLGSYFYGGPPGGGSSGGGGFGGGFGGLTGFEPCTSCPQSCQDYNTKRLSTSETVCDEFTFSTGGYCSTDCNNAQCERQSGTCTNDDALYVCTTADATKTFLKKPSTSYLNSSTKLMDTPITLKFGQVKLSTTNGVDPTKITAPISYTITWYDQRINPSAMAGSNGISINASLCECRDILPNMLKIPSSIAWIPGSIEQKTVETYYWLPRLAPANPAAAYAVTKRDFEYDAKTSRATFKTKLSGSYSQAETESDTPYFGFPFDVQTVYMKLKSQPTSQLIGCNQSWTLTAAVGKIGKLEVDDEGAHFADIDKLANYSVDAMNRLLPASGDWKFDTVEIDGPQVVTYLQGTDVCVIKMRLRRNPTVYILKAFLPDLIVMCIGMASLFINPAIPPLFGGRCSILIIAMLITMNGSLNRNNGLGKLSYLLKIDFVALGNLIMLLSAMFCSIIIHQMFRFKLDRMGVLLDRAVRISLPTIIFPGVQVFEFLLLSNDTSTAPVTFLLVYLGVAITLIVVFFLRKHWQDSAKVRAMSLKLKTLSLEDPNAPKILQEAFELFDADNSGALDAKEGRKLLKTVNPKLSRAMVAEAIRSADMNGNGIVEDDFQDMIMKWAKAVPTDSASEATTDEDAAQGAQASEDVELAQFEVKDLKA